MRSIVAAGVFLLQSLLAFATPAVGQDLNPYGRIDPVEASVSILRRSLGRDGSPTALAAMADAAPPEIDRLLEVALDHPNPAMRTTAAVRLAAREQADTRRLLARVGDDDAKAALVVALLGEGRLDATTAGLLLDGDHAGDSPIAVAILAGLARRDTDRARLEAIAEDASAPMLARGIAAGVLETSRTGAVDAWRRDLGEFGADAQSATLLAMATSLEKLDAIAGLRAIERATATRDADDAVRATVVLALLRLAPSDGEKAWKALAVDGEPGRLIPTAMLLVSADRPLPASMRSALPDHDSLQRSVSTLLAATPNSRVSSAIEAVRAGHLPTIRWLLDLPEDRVPTAVIEAMIDTSLTQRRAAMVEVLFLAARRLATTDARAAGRRLAEAMEDGDEVATEALLRGLIHAATPEAGAVSAPGLKASGRRTRSLALLATARAMSLDPPAIKRLGRAAAGGGDLPEDLRPLAAWHHIVLEGRVNDALTTLLKD